MLTLPHKTCYKQLVVLSLHSLQSDFIAAPFNDIALSIIVVTRRPGNLVSVHIHHRYTFVRVKRSDLLLSRDSGLILTECFLYVIQMGYNSLNNAESIKNFAIQQTKSGGLCLEK